MGQGTAWNAAGQRKKLIEAGYVHAQAASEGVDGLAEDEKYINLPESYRKRAKSNDFVINHDCWPAFEVFQFCATQWNFNPGGGRSGLSYPSVVAVIQSRELEVGPILEQVHYLELGALMAYNGADASKLQRFLYGEDV